MRKTLEENCHDLMSREQIDSMLSLHKTYSLILLILFFTANTDMGNHVIVLVGNKGDLSEARKVPRETAQQLADELEIR